MIVIADAGPLIHLHLVAASDWALPPAAILVVREVWREVEHHAPEVLNDDRLTLTEAPHGERPPALANLDSGEAAALALALRAPESVVLCDELAARRVCQHHAIDVIGSIGLIARAVRADRVDKTRAIRALRELPTRGRMHVTSDLIERAVASLMSE